MDVQMLEVSLLRAGAVFRLERDGCLVNGHMTKASNR